MKDRKNNADLKSTSTRKVRKRKFSWKLLTVFMAFELVFTAITGPFYLFYGPFQNVKRIIVGTAMATMNHQYIAKAFLSEDKIDEILKGGSSNTAPTAEGSEEQKLTDIQVPVRHDDSITRYDIQGKKFDAYILEIKDPTRVKVGITKRLTKEGQRTSQIAKDKGAIAAINGGGFTDKSTDGKLWAGTGAYPIGLVMSNGEILYSDLSSDNVKRDVVGLTKSGVLVVGNHSINDLKKQGIAEAISFGPPLVVNGRAQIDGDGDQGVNPRTAIGQKRDGTILLLVIDGRQGLKVGATLGEEQKILMDYGAWNATNLDGGSSSTMYYDGEIVNNPCDPLGERSVATAIYVEP